MPNDPTELPPAGGNSPSAHPRMGTAESDRQTTAECPTCNGYGDLAAGDLACPTCGGRRTAHEATPLPRVPMQPETWYARCPACERPHHLDGCEWEERDDGSLAAVDDARFPVCEYCKTKFEIAPMQVREAAMPADQKTTAFPITRAAWRRLLIAFWGWLAAVFHSDLQQLHHPPCFGNRL